MIRWKRNPGIAAMFTIRLDSGTEFDVDEVFLARLIVTSECQEITDDDPKEPIKPLPGNKSPQDGMEADVAVPQVEELKKVMNAIAGGVS